MNVQYCIGEDGIVVLMSGKNIRLNSGLETVRKKFNCRELPERVETRQPFPESLFQEAFGFPLESSKIIKMDGEMIQQAVAKCSLDQKTRAFRNNSIMEKGAEKSLEDGDISIGQYKSVKTDLELYASFREANEKLVDLHEPLPFTFTQYSATTDGNYVPVEGAKVTELTLEPYPGDTDRKKKNYWIYSKAPNYGKTHFKKALQNRAPIAVVRDVKNWTGVKPWAQFIIFDEFGKNENTVVDFTKLKQLTSSDGDVAFNRKMFGESFVPRKDVQVIVLSNHSGYEVYGKWCRETQEKRMTQDDYETFCERFHIYRLDGDDVQEKIQFVHLSALTSLMRLTSFELKTVHGSKFNVSYIVKTFFQAYAFAKMRADKTTPTSPCEVADLLDNLNPLHTRLNQLGLSFSWKDIATFFQIDTELKMNNMQEFFINVVREPICERAL